MNKTMISKPTIVAISGWKYSGKDTIAQYLIENYGARRLAFADSLKDLCSRLFEVERTKFDNPATKEIPVAQLPVQSKDDFSRHVNSFMQGEFKEFFWTPRALCILVGSCMRAADPDIWVKQAVRQAEPGKLYVISDARYRNEINSLKASGANVISVRINRFDTSPSTDPSERDLDNFDFDITIENRQTLEDLYKNLQEKLIPRLSIAG